MLAYRIILFYEAQLTNIKVFVIADMVKNHMICVNNFMWYITEPNMFCNRAVVV